MFLLSLATSQRHWGFCFIDMHLVVLEDGPSRCPGLSPPHPHGHPAILSRAYPERSCEGLRRGATSQWAAGSRGCSAQPHKVTSGETPGSDHLKGEELRQGVRTSFPGQWQLLPDQEAISSHVWVHPN